MYLKTAKEVMTSNMIVASPNETVSQAINKMEKHGVKEIPIIENNELLGMVTYYDILDFVRLDPDEKITGLMISPPTVRPETTAEEIAKIMLKSGVEGIPVTEKGKVMGIVSDYDLAREFVNDQKIKNLKVRDLMKQDVSLIKEDEPISSARRLMRYHKSDRLPVVDDNGKLIGVINSLDILKNFYSNPKEKIGRKDRIGEQIKPFDMPVSAIMKRVDSLVYIEDDVPSALKKMMKDGVKGTPVVDKENKVVGIFMRWDILDKIVERKFEDGVWLNFSGFQPSLDAIEIIKNYISSQIKKLRRLEPKLLGINIHIKTIHGASPEKWNYELVVKLDKSSGKRESVALSGFNIMYTVDEALKKLEKQLERKNRRGKGKAY